jgi:hypothetical protein
MGGRFLFTFGGPILVSPHDRQRGWTRGTHRFYEVAFRKSEWIPHVVLCGTDKSVLLAFFSPHPRNRGSTSHAHARRKSPQEMEQTYLSTSTQMCKISKWKVRPCLPSQTKHKGKEATRQSHKASSRPSLTGNQWNACIGAGCAWACSSWAGSAKAGSSKARLTEWAKRSTK